MYSSDGKAEFSAAILQSSVSHDPSEIRIADSVHYFGTFGTWDISYY